MRKLTPAEFRIHCKDVHGDKYNEHVRRLVKRPPNAPDMEARWEALTEAQAAQKAHQADLAKGQHRLALAEQARDAAIKGGINPLSEAFAQYSKDLTAAKEVCAALEKRTGLLESATADAYHRVAEGELAEHAIAAAEAKRTFEKLIAEARAEAFALVRKLASAQIAFQRANDALQMDTAATIDVEGSGDVGFSLQHAFNRGHLSFFIPK